MKEIIFISLLVVILLLSCRLNVVEVDDVELWIVCDTINVKYNPRDSITTCTLRCVDKFGNESIIYINCDE